MAKKIVIDPVNRIEGDLRVELEIEENVVQEARCKGIMFRGFERIMSGRDPMDALVITPRVCGICSASHGVASSKALKMAMGAQIPANGYYMKNMILGTEVIMSHLTQFYFLFAPDLTNPRHKDLKSYPQILERFKTMQGTSVVRALKARQSMLEIMGLVAGKWPNTLAIHPAGSTATLNLSTKTRANGILQEFQVFLEEVFLGCSLEEWLDIDSYEKLESWLEYPLGRLSDLALFWKFCLEAGLDRLGKGPGRFLSYGSFEVESGQRWLRPGFFAGHYQNLDQNHILEVITASYFRDALPARHPLEGVTVPFANKKGGYSWAKAPRYKGLTAEVGPLARLIIADEPLVVDLFQIMGPSVLTRMFARLREMILLTRELSRWLELIDPENPFYGSLSAQYADQGIGLTEAARGSLGHWMTIASNRIENYQIITPSAWNMSPRDEQGIPGPLEEALTGVEVQDLNNPVEVYHVIRSFDPCMACTVH